MTGELVTGSGQRELPNDLDLGQEQTSEKSNEMTAVPLLLRQLELASGIVTVHALNTQKTIARLRRKPGVIQASFTEAKLP